ncbi:MAG: DUF2252 domain-containing protein [Brasilonema angustatum HA4187-MV1]|nr:DUF2252 domain-containing protein [Brasilonema angustatum HA4187-MV1]
MHLENFGSYKGENRLVLQLPGRLGHELIKS